jgi:hypothetical protein
MPRIKGIPSGAAVEGEPGLWSWVGIPVSPELPHDGGGRRRVSGQVIAERLQALQGTDQPRQRVFGRRSATWHPSTTAGAPVG